jgi:hypothetical protein
MLNLSVHIHILKEDELIPAFAIRLHGFVLIDGFCQAGNEECRERQGLPSFCFVLPQASARLGHIDFKQTMADPTTAWRGWSRSCW